MTLTDLMVQVEGSIRSRMGSQGDAHVEVKSITLTRDARRNVRMAASLRLTIHEEPIDAYKALDSYVADSKSRY